MKPELEKNTKSEVNFEGGRGSIVISQEDLEGGDDEVITDDAK